MRFFTLNINKGGNSVYYILADMLEFLNCLEKKKLNFSSDYQLRAEILRLKFLKIESFKSEG